MNIDFPTFLQKTGYTAAYAARKILYFPKSRPALMADTLELDVGSMRKELVSIVNGKLIVSQKTKAKASDLEINVKNTPKRVNLCRVKKVIK